MNRRNGYTSIETVLVMLLLIAVSFLVFATVSAGSNAFLNLSEKRGRDTDLRVGMSFIDVKLRKNDAVVQDPKGSAISGITVVDNPFEPGRALRIQSEEGGRRLYTWIYCRDGQLYELFQVAESTPDATLAVRVAQIDQFELTLDPDDARLVRVSLRVDETGNREAALLSSWFLIRTGVASE